MELESDTYDVVVIGTGLAQSIAAAALAKSGKSVLHLDPNEYYGDRQASLTLDELQQWCQSNREPLESTPANAIASASSSTLDETLTKNRRRYALSLFPAILPSRGPLIQTLINSGVSKYVSFRMLDSVSVWQSASEDKEEGIRRVPGSKEQVFKDKEISLMEKRRLMKFLMFSAGEFEKDPLLKGKEKEAFPDFLEETFNLPTDLASQVAYAIAHCSAPDDETLEALNRTRRYIKSIGRYGSGAFLVGQYGGAGEIAQGFCRACAVFGGTYVLGKESIPDSITVNADSVTLKIPCHPRPIAAKHLITSPDHLPPNLRSESGSSSGTNTTAHCIALLSSLPDALRRPKAEPVDGEEEGEDDTAVIVFPPEGNQGLVRALVMGEGTGSCPAGQFVLYLSTSSTADPKEVLQPFLTRLSPEPLFESYYTLRRSPGPKAEEQPSPVVVLDLFSGLEVLTEGLDWEAEQGEKAFWKVMGDGEMEDGKGFFEKVEDEGLEEEEEL